MTKLIKGHLYNVFSVYGDKRRHICVGIFIEQNTRYCSLHGDRIEGDDELVFQNCKESGRMGGRSLLTEAFIVAEPLP